MKLLCSLLLLFALPRVSVAVDAAEAVALVAGLYRECAWEVVIQEPRGEDFFFEGSQDTLERYLTPELAALVLADRARAHETGDLGALDFAPLWDSQDPGASQLTIRAEDDSSAVRVSFVYPGSEDRIELVVRVSPTSAGPRVADIEYASGATLRGVLKQD